MAQSTAKKRPRPAAGKNEELVDSGGEVSLYREGRWLATFTRGASTATLHGPLRIFSDATAPRSICHSVWVRILPQPFAGAVDGAWLAAADSANRQRVPDILAIAMQYTRGAPAVHNGNMQIAGQAAYGPLAEDGKRVEGSDFNDYLGLVWNYPGGFADFPEPDQFRCLDCSGFLRMLFGFRNSLTGSSHAGYFPLSRDPLPGGAAIPRRANEIFESAPGVVVIANSGSQPASFDPLRIGDLVFFDTDPGDGPRLDHAGLYLGTDTAGDHRFLSSRKKHNGPTFGDEGGRSALNGSGLYPRSFRAARRL